MVYEFPDYVIETACSGCCCPPGQRRQGMHTNATTSWIRIGHKFEYDPFEEWVNMRHLPVSNSTLVTYLRAARSAREFCETLHRELMEKCDTIDEVCLILNRHEEIYHMTEGEAPDEIYATAEFCRHLEGIIQKEMELHPTMFRKADPTEKQRDYITIDGYKLQERTRHDPPKFFPFHFTHCPF